MIPATGIPAGRVAFWWLRTRVRFARWLTWWRVIYPLDYDAARNAASAIKETLEHSGHLSWRYHVRRDLENYADAFTCYSEEVWK